MFSVSNCEFIDSETSPGPCLVHSGPTYCLGGHFAARCHLHTARSPNYSMPRESP